MKFIAVIETTERYDKEIGQHDLSGDDVRDALEEFLKEKLGDKAFRLVNIVKK